MTFQRVLICFDGSPLGVRAAEHGYDIAKAIGASVALVHAIDPTPLPTGGAIIAEHDARQMLDAFCRRTSLEVATFVGLGKPAVEIVAVARQWGADLIVLGARGHGRLDQIMLGNVADAVIRHAPCAVMTVRVPSRLEMTARRMLIAVDGSELAGHAASLGGALAATLGVKVALVHVIDPDGEIGVGAPRTEREAMHVLTGVEEATSPGAVAFVMFGSPATAIVEAAQQWQADLVVVGSHGRGRAAQMVLGSVAEAVIRHTPGVVLVVPRPENT